MENKITTLFKKLRKQGFVAKQNFSCCGNCAGYAIATQVSAAIDAGKKTPLGVITYHKQATESWKRTGELYLSYGVIGTEKHGDIGLPTERVGKRICAELQALGIPYEWNGDPMEKIVIRMDIDKPLLNIKSWRTKQ